MNLLRNPIFCLADGRRTSLPGVFAAMTGGQANPVSSALRPHQRPAWHMFLVQLATLALWREPLQDLPTDEEFWRTALRRLTSEFPDDSPWELVVDDRRRPAFLQPPVPEGLKWTGVETADALDMLITARNHDLKSAIARKASIEDWVYALISLQTCEGYNGRGNHGIARMNGGSSSRPMLGLAPANEGDLSIDFSARWNRDVKRLIAERQRESASETPKPALLWCFDWPENHQLAWSDLDPLCIEVCRRIRFSLSDGHLTAHRSTSRQSRIDAKMLKGNTGDPWAPVQQPDGKSLTLGSGNFDYKRLYDLLFSGSWKRPFLSRHSDDDTGPMVLIAEAFARGNSKTEGSSPASSLFRRISPSSSHRTRPRQNWPSYRSRRSRALTWPCGMRLRLSLPGATLSRRNTTHGLPLQELGLTAKPTASSSRTSGSASAPIPRVMQHGPRPGRRLSRNSSLSRNPFCCPPSRPYPAQLSGDTELQPVRQDDFTTRSGGPFRTVLEIRNDPYR